MSSIAAHVSKLCLELTKLSSDEQTNALAAMESAGIEVHDIADRNTVFDGTTVRIIDFV